MPGEATQVETKHNSRMEKLGSAAAGIAHDINNQLFLILNHLAMPDLEAARQATARCSALTASLLAYCRGEAIRLRPLDVRVFLWDFLDQLRLPKTIQLIVDVPSSLPLVNADPAALTRAPTNLISNACDAMNGSGALRISASPDVIAITD